MNAPEEIISAALDGERVDVEELTRALQTAEGREALAAFTLLRAMTAADDAAPGEATWLPAAAEAGPSARTAAGWSRTARWWSLADRRVPTTLAASIAIVAVAISFWLGATWPGGGRQPGHEVTQARTATPGPMPGDGGHQPTVPPATRLTQVSAPQPCGPSQNAPMSASTQRARADEMAVPPTPTRFLRFVPGVDWTTKDGAIH